MQRHFAHDDVRVLPDDLRAFAWSAPMRELAARLDMSDVGLRKLLTACGVPPPPQGYWNKLRAGKPVPALAPAPPRRPGESGRIRLDRRFAQVLPSAPPLPSAGPFASAAVPEDLEELRGLELKAVSRAAVPANLDRAHPSLRRVLDQEARRAAKFAATGYSWDAPRYADALGRRTLRILNAILLTLARRGHDGDVSEHQERLHARAIVGGTYLGLRLEERRETRRKVVPELSGRATAPAMSLVIDAEFDASVTAAWHDDAEGRLETKLAGIVAGIIVAGEARFRRGLLEAEEREEQFRVAEVRRREARLAELNEKRVADLHRSGELLRQADDLRALVQRVRGAIEARQIGLDQVVLEAWIAWATGEADRLDPVLSGQVLSHLREPTPE